MERGKGRADLTSGNRHKRNTPKGKGRRRVREGRHIAERLKSERESATLSG